MERNGDDEFGKRKRVMRDAFREQLSERLGGRGDEAVLESEDEFLEEAMSVGTSDKETVERGQLSTVTTGSAIFLIGLATNGAFLVLAFGDGFEASRANESALGFATEATEWEKEIDAVLTERAEGVSERGQCHGGSRERAFLGGVWRASFRRGQTRRILGRSFGRAEHPVQERSFSWRSTQ